jgi:hypothetical protein
MTEEQAKEIVEAILAKFRDKDSELIIRNVNERSITHKLAEYLQPLVPNFHVDCEYNRNQERPKYILTLERRRRESVDRAALISDDEDVADGALKRSSTYPDIIVHERNSNEQNKLIIEVKVEPANGDEDWDLDKLKAFTEQDGANGYRYTHGVFVALTVDNEQKAVWTLRWFANGRECSHSFGTSDG